MEVDATSAEGQTRTGPPESFGLSAPLPARPEEDTGPEILSRVDRVEGVRDNPPLGDLRQRSMAREAYAVLQDYIETWQPHYQPKKLELTKWWKDTSRQYNVLRADARLMGFEDPLTPLHFLFFSSPRISRAAGKYSPSVKDVSGIEEHEPGLWIRFFDEDWAEELKVVEKEEVTDSEFLREHGESTFRGARGIPQLAHSFETVSAVLEHVQKDRVRRMAATLDVTPSPPDPQELNPEEFVDELVRVIRKDKPTSMTNDADKAERAVREAVGNLRALKRQLAHILQERKSTFIHEFQHHFDRSRIPDEAITGSTTVKDRLGLPTSNYWNADIEVNARFQQGLAEFEEVMLSNPNFMRSKIKKGFDERGLIRLLKQFTPAYEKLNEENQRRLITRWTKYYNQIVEPRIERLKAEMGEGEESEGGLPEDLQALLQAAETLADAQNTFETAREEAGGPLSRTMEEDRRLEALDTKIREGFPALREKAEEKGYDFDTILERTALEPVRENPPYVRPEELARENRPEPEAKRHLERHGEILDPDLYVTGFPGEPENTMTEKGIEGAKFKMWFGDWQDPDSDHSVVTDEEGRPMEVYHGTQSGGFNRFMVGADLRDRGSPGVFFTDRRRHALSYSGSNEDIGPTFAGPVELTEPEFGFEVEVRRFERRAYEVTDEDGEVVDTVLEESLRFPEVLDEYEEEGYDIEETRVDRYDVIHRGVQVLYNGTENEKIVAIEKIAQEANDRAEIPPGQKEGILTAYLNIRDPLVIDFEGETWDDPPPDIGFFSINEAARYAMNAGYDGLIAKNVWGPGPEGGFADAATEYIVFHGDQVAVQGARSSDIAIPRAETDPRLNPTEPPTEEEVEQITESIKDAYETTSDIQSGVLLPDGTLVPIDGVMGNPVQHADVLPDAAATPSRFGEGNLARREAKRAAGAARVRFWSRPLVDLGMTIQFGREPTDGQIGWIETALAEEAPEKIEIELSDPDSVGAEILRFGPESTVKEIRRGIRSHYGEATSKVAQMRARLNPNSERQVEEFTEAVLDQHAELARRSNPEYTRETYPGVFEDYDRDEIPTVDDPHPLTPGDEETVEEVSLAREIEKLLRFRQDRAETTQETEERLSRWMPGDATIKSRTKTPYSILNKLRRKRLEGPKGIEDISGAMVVVEDSAELREIRERIEEDEAIGQVREVENHYNLPGPYRAVHYIVEVDGAPVEIQVKTQRQASLANAAHGPYKRGTIDNDEMGRIAGLAHRADTGDEEAADEVDPMLSDTNRLEERLTERKNPLVDAQVDTDREAPTVTDSFFVDVTTEVVYPSPGTDRGFRLETSTLGETYAYGFARTDEFGGEEFEGLAELSWIQVDEAFRGEGVGVRLLGDVLRFLAATGASHVAVRPLFDAARGLNERAEDIGLWHETMKSESGMEMYAIDVDSKSRLGVPLAGRDFEFDANRNDVEDAIRFLYEPSDVVWSAAAQPIDARPWTYAQPLRPAASSGDLDSEYNRDVEIYETFEEAPGVSKQNGFFFRTDAPITAQDLTRTSAEPVGIDTRTWTVLNAVNAYQEEPGLPEFAITNRSKKWLMEIEQGEGESDGKTLVTFSRPGNRDIETHEHNSLQDALEETLRFRDRGDKVEYLPMEFADTALDQWEEEERENPAEGLTERGVAEATRMLAYELRRHLWERGRLTLNDNGAIDDLLSVADRIESGEIDVDPLAFQPIPTGKISKGVKIDLQSALESVGDLRTIEEFAEEEVMPFVEEGMEADPFDPYATSDDLPDLLKRQLPRASSWQETGYVTPGGTPLSLGGRGKRRMKDHRDPHVPERFMPDWINPEKNFASMLMLMEEGVLRVSPSQGVLRLEVNREPTAEQRQWIESAILSGTPPSEVILDLGKPGEDAEKKVSGQFGAEPGAVMDFIDQFYRGSGTSKVARFRRMNPRGTLSDQMADLYPTWRPRDRRPKIGAQHVKWIMPGGQAIGAKPEDGDEIHHNHFELPDEFETEEMPRRELVDRGALSVWVTIMSGLDHVALNVVSGAPMTDAQKTTVRDLVAEIGADKVVGALSDARGEESGSVPSEQIEADSTEEFIERVEDFYASDAGRANPNGEDPAYVLAVGDTQSANLQQFKPNSQRLVVMSPGKYLKHVREHFEDTPGGTPEAARESIMRESPNVSGERIQEMKERMTERRPLDALWFDVRLEQQGSDSPIIGQEGRHRAIAAKELGIRHVPVILYAHRQKAGSGLFGGVADVKVPADGEEFPERIMAGATDIDWPSSPTPTKTLWREAKFGREFA